MASIPAAGGSLAIFFEPDEAKQQSSLSDEVLQIISQRGAFRNINERTLLEEINQPNSISTDQAQKIEVQDDSDEEEGPQTRQEKLLANRNEFLQKLSTAQNDVLSALDFVSLLLSNHSVVAQTSMSAVLKELVPPKTLDSRVIQVDDLPPKVRLARQMVSQGWKSESFKATSTRLASASTRLKGETQHQGKYWEQIAHLKARGWPISRLPNDSRAIGVHFGFPESSPLFRNRALTLLQQSDTGKLELDSRAASRSSTRLRFAVRRRGVETGSSELSSFDPSQDDGIHSELVTVRDAIFEEELYYEVSREARAIAGQGVRTHLNAVEIDISDDCQILVINEPSNSPPKIQPTQTGKDYGLASLISLSMRLLLLAEHRRNHERRSRPPAPMTLAPRPVPEYAIIRPIVARLRHQANLSKVAHLLDILSRTLKSCGIMCEVKTSGSDTGMGSPAARSISSLRGSARSQVSLVLDGRATVMVGLDTYLGPPLYGTMYDVSASNDEAKSLDPASTPSLAEIKSSIRDGITLLLNHSIKSWTETSGNNGTDVLWTLTRPHSGEFLVTKDLRTLAKVLVKVQPGAISLHVQRSGASIHRSNPKEMYSWRADGMHGLHSHEGGASNTESLREVISNLSNSFKSDSKT